jgi:phospholipase C
VLSDLLDAQGLSWYYYAPKLGTIWTAPNAIEHMCQEQNIGGSLVCSAPEWQHNVIIPSTQILTDIANGQLPQVSWVIPAGAYSDHAHSNDGSGPSWVASIVNAIGNSPYWSNTAIIVTWDDWGGWYDHVAPRIVNDGISWIRICLRISGSAHRRIPVRQGCLHFSRHARLWQHSKIRRGQF